MKRTIIFDKPLYYTEGSRFIPQVGVNTTIVKLEGHLKSDLNWKREKEIAKKLIEEGQTIFWELDLGLFSKLSLPLTNQSQFLSFCLSLEHFRDSVWNEFGDQSLGVSIYRGSADFTSNIAWDTELQNQFEEWNQLHFIDKTERIERKTLFCRDIAAEYLGLLRLRLSDSIPVYIDINLGEIRSHILQSLMIHPERWDHFNYYLQNCTLPFVTLGSKPIHSAIGVCLPSMDFFDLDKLETLNSVIKKLTAEKIPYRIIAESHLTTEWDGLDKLIYEPEAVSSQGQRKLQGFVAAGGDIIKAEAFIKE